MAKPLSLQQAAGATVTSLIVNSPEYWNERFRGDWDARLGPQQTVFFADLLIKHLPKWLVREIERRRLSIYDFGCAKGDAIPLLAARFPRSNITGGDVSTVAVEYARNNYSNYSFDILPSKAPTFSADVVISSNTFEHFSDWQKRLERVAACARHSIILLVPFQEQQPLLHEHVTTFDFGTLPPRLVCGARLVFHSVIDTSDLPGSRWNGRQVLAVWSHTAAAKTEKPHKNVTAVDFTKPTELDLRRVPPSAVPFLMALAKRADHELRIHAAREAAMEGELRDVRTGREIKDWFVELLQKERAASDRLHRDMIEYSVQLAKEKDEALHTLDLDLKHIRVEKETAEKAAEAERQNLEAASLAKSEQIVQKQEAIARLQTEIKHRIGQLQFVLTNIREVVSQHNQHLEMQRMTLQANIDSARSRFSQLVEMNSSHYTTRLLQKYRRLRGNTIAVPAVPPRTIVSFEKLDLCNVLNNADGALLDIKDIAAPSPREPAPLVNTAKAFPLIRSDYPCILMQVANLDRGGVEQVIYDLTHGLVTRRKRVVTLVLGTGGEIADRLSRAGMEVIVLGGYTPEAYSGAIAELSIEAAIIHHSYEGLDQLANRGVPIVEVVHNFYHWKQSQPSDYLKETKAVTKRVAVSASVANFHAEAFALQNEDIEVIWNPINSEGFIRPERHLLERARNTWKSEFIFINVAQFFPAKAQAGLISAFEQIHRRYPHTRLRLVGAFTDAAVKSQILAQIEMAGIQNAVELPGFVGRRALSQLYTTSHVFVQPSVYEGFSVAMAEAAHFALPMILTRIGGAVDIIKDNDCGILIPPHFDSLIGKDQATIFKTGRDPKPPNLAALMNAMERMITEYDTWISRGFIGQARVDRMTVDEAAARYLNVLTRIGVA